MLKAKLFEFISNAPCEDDLDDIREFLKTAGSEIAIALNKNTLIITHDDARGGLPWKVSALALRNYEGAGTKRIQKCLDMWFNELAPTKVLGPFLNDSVLLIFYR